LLVVLLLVASVEAQQKSEAVKDPKLQAAINKAISRGVGYLRKSQRRDGTWAWGGGHKVYRAGITAICLYAMAASSVPADDPEISRGLSWVKHKATGYRSGSRYATYSASLLTLALARIDPVEHKQAIHRLAARIVAGQGSAGRWSYTLKGGGGDLSNSQFAIMALWAAGTVGGAKIPRRAWERVRRSLQDCQGKDGSWSYGYQAGTGTPAMTAAGLFGYVAAYAALNGGPGSLPEARKQKQARKGLAALLRKQPYANYYFCYALERAATIMNAPPDQWYVEGARYLVGKQLKNGSWNDPYNTSLALLFLTRATRFVITPRRAAVTAREVKFPERVTADNLGRAFEAYLLTDESKRVPLLPKFATAGPPAIGMFIERLADPELAVRVAAYTLLRALLDKPLLFDPKARADERRIMLKPIRAWWEREGGRLKWNADVGRFQS
jgi:hypothetical protein